MEGQKLELQRVYIPHPLAHSLAGSENPVNSRGGPPARATEVPPAREARLRMPFPSGGVRLEVSGLRRGLWGMPGGAPGCVEGREEGFCAKEDPGFSACVLLHHRWDPSVPRRSYPNRI